MKKISRNEKYEIVITILSLVVIVLGIMTIISMYYYQVPYLNYLKKMIWNIDGFDWSSITSLVAVIGVFLTIRHHNKSIRAEVISKERTRWLVNHKKITSDFLANIIHYLQMASSFNRQNSLLEKIKDEDIKKEKISEMNTTIQSMNELYPSIVSAYLILNLELNKNSEDNRILLETTEEVYEKWKGVLKIENLRRSERLKETIEYKNLMQRIKELSDISNEYYSNVWQQIKNNE